MRKSNVNESQIVGILKEAESGVPVADLLRQHGISKTTFQSTPRRPSFSNPRQTVRRLATNRLVFSPDFRFRCGTVTHRISSRALIARVPT